jgi:glycosyltransferase involved in cell wall biosynthesis
MSGGCRYMLELVKYLTGRKINNVVLTTRAGRITFEQLGLKENEFCRYITIPDFYNGGNPLLLLAAYIRRAMPASKLVSSVPVRGEDVLYCHNEFYPNIIPMAQFARAYPAAKAIYHLHMLAPDLFKGFQGQFTGEFHLPDLRLVNYKFQQWLMRKLVVRRGVIVSNNKYYIKTLEHLFPEHKTYNISRYGGIDIPEVESVKEEYDLVWLGRFHEQKGIKEIPDIIQEIKKEKPDIKLAIIGSGKKWEKWLKKVIRQYGLNNNIELKGFLEGEAKIRTLKSARIFFMTSYYEGNPQVILEAMKCGLPVAAYNLPVYRVFERGMIKVPVKDNQAMAKEIIKLLNNRNHYEAIKQQALSFADNFNWEETGKEVLSFLQQVKND